jgi:hypothetical protein
MKMTKRSVGQKKKKEFLKEKKNRIVYYNIYTLNVISFYKCQTGYVSITQAAKIIELRVFALKMKNMNRTRTRFLI